VPGAWRGVGLGLGVGVAERLVRTVAVAVTLTIADGVAGPGGWRRGGGGGVTWQAPLWPVLGMAWHGMRLSVCDSRRGEGGRGLSYIAMHREGKRLPPYDKGIHLYCDSAVRDNKGLCPFCRLAGAQCHGRRREQLTDAMGKTSYHGLVRLQ
jgi:hypothetical protein